LGYLLWLYPAVWHGTLVGYSSDFWLLFPPRREDKNVRFRQIPFISLPVPNRPTRKYIFRPLSCVCYAIVIPGRIRNSPFFRFAYGFSIFPSDRKQRVLRGACLCLWSCRLKRCIQTDARSRPILPNARGCRLCRSRNKCNFRSRRVRRSIFPIRRILMFDANRCIGVFAQNPIFESDSH